MKEEKNELPEAEEQEFPELDVELEGVELVDHCQTDQFKCSSAFIAMLAHCASDYFPGKVILEEAAEDIINALLISCSLYVGGQKHMFLRIGITDNVTTLMDETITPHPLDDISETNPSLILMRSRVFQGRSDIDVDTSESGGLMTILWIDSYVFRLTGLIIVSKCGQGSGRLFYRFIKITDIDAVPEREIIVHHGYVFFYARE